MEIRAILIDSAKLIRKNLMVIQPLFLGVLVIMFASKPIFTRTSLDTGFIISAILIVLLISAFISGWYNCIKYTVSLNNKIYTSAEEVQKEQLTIIKQFFPGVAEYFLSVTAILFLYICIAYGVSFAVENIIQNMFSASSVPQDLFKVFNSSNQQEIVKLVGSLNNSQLETIIKALGITAFFVFLFHFLILWFGPALFYTSKNPIYAVFVGIKFLFKNFLTSLIILFVMILINIFITFLSVLCGTGILSFIPFLCLFFYILYYIVTVFLYYEQKTKNYCTNGCKLNRKV